MVLMIVNLEGHQNCMISSKVTTILTMFLVDELRLSWIWNQFTVDDGGVSGEGLSLFPLVTGGR